MNKIIKLNNSDKLTAAAVRIVDKIEDVDCFKLGVSLSAVASIMFALSTKSVRNRGIKFVNSVYEKFRLKYNIADSDMIFIHLNHIEFIDL